MLELDDIHVNYGGLAALRGVSLRVDQGEVVCILGPNGAGKSTTLAAIAGGVRPHRGAIRLNRIPLIGKPPESISRLGVSLVPEGRHVFATLSVEENLRIGSYQRRDHVRIEADLEETLTLFPRLRERLLQPAGRLSGGEQQMLVICRAMMTRPSLMLIDELSLGLAPMIVDQVYGALLERCRHDGVTLLINEQSSERILKFADRIYVLRSGGMRLEGRASDLRDGKAVMSAYFGFDDNAQPSAGEGRPG
jgi:branched-chain amino acid transport system ATP-binding protein